MTESRQDKVQHYMARGLWALVVDDIAALDPADPVRVAAEAQLAEHDRHYGIPHTAYLKTARNRGLSLVYYFKSHLHLLRGRAVAHVAPEPELRAWLTDVVPKLGGTYMTMDAFAANVDWREDLAALTLLDGCLDVVICHQVLEHVPDDARALREIYRVLRPGGVVNLSVPEALYLERTVDWGAPDAQVYGHIRTYGRDVVAKLQAAGFAAGRIEWLLRRPAEELATAGAYPMLHYFAVKA